MSLGAVLRSQATAWIIGALLLAGFSAVAFSLLGWIGIGAVGILGLFVTTQAALSGGQSIAGEDARLYARQLEETRRSQSSPEQKMAAAAKAAQRAKLLYVLNTIFIAMAVLGVWMFVRQLQAA